MGFKKATGTGAATGAAAGLFTKIDYASLNAKQKEVHNFHHIAAILARHGYASYPIRDDWNGGDMIARHMTDPNKEMLTIQIKGRPTFDRKYQNKNLWIGFPHDATNPSSDVYIYPHDETMGRLEQMRAAKGQQPLQQTGAWQKDGLYSWGSPPRDLLQILEPYRVSLTASGPSPAHDVCIQQDRLSRLAGFTPSLRGPIAHWVEVAGPRGAGTSDDPFVMGSVSPRMTRAAMEFTEMLYEAGWVLDDFDWSAWAGTEECQNFLSSPGTIAKASDGQLSMLLTVLARRDRFVDGALCEAFENGAMLAIAERAAVMVGSAS